MPQLCYITNRQICPIPLLDNIKRVIDAGVDLIQIREKDLSTKELLSLARSARALVKGHQTRILVNDRLDVALVAELDGIHLGQSSISAHQVRGKLLRPDFLIGVSTHSVEEVRLAESRGASFVTFGPIFFTPSKAIYGAPVGLEPLKRVCQFARIPVLALGGIDQSNYAECLLNGAAGFAAIRLFQEPDVSIQAIVRKIKQH